MTKVYTIIDANGNICAPSRRGYGTTGNRVYSRLCDLTASVGRRRGQSDKFVVEYELVEVKRTPVPQYLEERKQLREQRKREREEYKVRNSYDWGI